MSLILLLVLLVACSPEIVATPEPAIEESPTPAATPTAQPRITATTEPSASMMVIATSTHTAPTHTPEPESSDFFPLASNLDGFSDGLLLATHDNALVIYYPGTAEMVTLLEPGMYNLSNDGEMIPLIWPVRFAPDGQRVLVPTPNDGTWLVGLEGTRARFHAKRLFATWSPDGRRVAYVNQTGQFASPYDGDVYAADPAEDAPTTPLASLPGSAGSAVWSPGCAEPATPERACGRFIAVATTAKEGLILWLVDSDSGEARELGRFRPPPIGGTLWHWWTADGSAVIAQADSATIAFPINGREPRPLVVEHAPSGRVPGDLSPAGTLYARQERGVDHYSTMIVGNLETGEEIRVAPAFSQGEAFHWSEEGRYLLVSNYGCAPDACVYEVWAIDTNDFPEMGRAFKIAEASAYLGPLSHLMEKSSEVSADEWAATQGLPEAREPETWEAHDLPEAGIRFHAPAGWRVEVDDQSFIVSNYSPLTDGIVALSDEQIRIDGSWSGDYGNTIDYGNVTLLEDMYFNWEVIPIEANGTPGVVLRDAIAPICDQVVLPHRGGELNLTYCPATERWRSWVPDFLAGLELSPE
jgi:hypothetical protein